MKRLFYTAVFCLLATAAAAQSLPGMGGFFGFGTGGLPPGAVGAWYADQALTTAGNVVVPNSLITATPSKNLLRSPRRLGGGSLYSVSNVVITDNVSACADGTTTASEIVGTGNWALFAAAPSTAVTVPTGTYTIVVNAKRGVGSDQSFKIQGDTLSATKTATSAYQRFTHTFTLAAPTAINITIQSFDGATDATLLVCDFEMFQGASDPGQQVFASHMYVGQSAFSSTVPTISGGYINFTTTGSLGLIQFPTPLSLSTFTVTAIYQQINPAAATGTTLVIERSSLFTNFGLRTTFNDTTKTGAGGSFSGAGFGQASGMWNMIGAASPHMITFRYDGLTIDIFHDDVLVDTNSAVALSPVTVADMFVSFASGAASEGDKIGALAMWQRALTNTEIYQTFDSFRTHFLPIYTITPWQYYYFADGDSIPANSTGYPYLFGPNSTHPVFGYNFSQGGSTLADLVARQSTVIAALPPVSRRTGRFFAISIGVGSNDLSVITAPTLAASYATYLDNLQVGGYLALPATVVDRTGVGNGPTWLTNTQAFNTILTTAWGHGTAIIDFAANIHFLPGSGAADDLTYYDADKVHPNQTGQDLLETISRPIINGVLP